MPGVRIQHPTERNVNYTLMDGSRPYLEPYDCPACHRVHQFKAYHFRLDETGSTIVSVEIAQRLKRLPMQPFAISNEVAKPPDQTIHVPLINLRTRVLAPGATH